jgi:hypothetical protein
MSARLSPEKFKLDTSLFISTLHSLCIRKMSYGSSYLERPFASLHRPRSQHFFDWFGISQAKINFFMEERKGESDKKRSRFRWRAKKSDVRGRKSWRQTMLRRVLVCLFTSLSSAREEEKQADESFAGSVGWKGKESFEANRASSICFYHVTEPLNNLEWSN